VSIDVPPRSRSTSSRFSAFARTIPSSNSLPQRIHAVRLSLTPRGRPIVSPSRHLSQLVCAAALHSARRLQAAVSGEWLQWCNAAQAPRMGLR